MSTLAFFNKWLHLLSMISLLGGAIVMLCVVIPGIRGTEMESGEGGRQLHRRFGLLLAVSWAVVLATGFLNYVLVSPSVDKSYHMLLGMKIALAFVMLAVSMI